MIVQGMLEKAQFENLLLSGTFPTLTPTGRVIMDVTIPAPAVPYIYDGANWRAFLLAPASPVFNAGNSGTAVTINWANGNLQRLTLTGHCVISFSNPVEGASYQLIIKQSTSSTFTCVLPSDIHWKRKPVYQLPVTQNDEKIYAFLYSLATLPASATTLFAAIQNPATIAPAVGSGVTYSSLGDLVHAYGTTPFKSAWQLKDVSYGALWSPRATGTALPGIPTAVAFSPGDDFVVFAHATSPFVTCDPWNFNSGGGFGVAVADPGTLPAGAGKAISFSSTGGAVAVGHASSPFITAWPFTAGTFGTKVADPGTLPTGIVQGIAFSPNNAFIATAHLITPFMSVYAWTDSAGFGARSTNPVTLPAGSPGTGKCIAFRPQGDFVALGFTGGAGVQCIQVYPFNQATGAIGIALNPAIVTNTTVSAVQWSPDGLYLAAGYAASPFLSLVPFNPAAGGSFGSAVTFAGSNPGSAVFDLEFHPSGEFLTASITSSPFLITYPMPTQAKNFINIAQ